MYIGHGLELELQSSPVHQAVRRLGTIYITKVSDHQVAVKFTVGPEVSYID